jgi:gamma-glutamylaminecyclotransferase
MYKIFVYGTLKEGFPNFEINKGTRLSGNFITNNQFSLYLVSERYSPWLVPDDRKGSNVKGQVFSVDESTLKNMDKLERVSKPDGYHRVEITVKSLESNQEQDVLAYIKLTEQLDTAGIQSKLNDEYLLEHASLYKSLNL